MGRISAKDNNYSDFDIAEYSFNYFSKKKDEDAPEVEDYKLHELSQYKKDKIKKMQDVIKTERNISTKSRFQISPIVREYRGIKEQEIKDYEKRVNEEVQKQLSFVEDKAFKQGHILGQEKGYEEAKKEVLDLGEKKVEVLASMLAEISRNEEKILLNQKKNIMELVRTLTKWIILRELSNDGDYIPTLLEKLILELQEKKNLLVRVNDEKFKDMPEIIELVEKKLGVLVNVRYEVDHEIQDTGIVVESDNGILDGTLEAQLKILDNVFEKMDLHE